MNSVVDLRAHLADLLRAALESSVPQAPSVEVILERPKSAAHGDYACNVAMQLAKPLRRNPRDIANGIVSAMPQSPLVQKAEVAGAGFINLHLDPGIRQQNVPAILQAGANYGRLNVGNGQRIQIEFVSANPTGPLHVGHGRGAAYGASLANMLDATGYTVTREYYVNDAGRQMDILALSTWLRYLEVAGLEPAFPGNAYQGEYVRDMARAIYQQHAARYVHPVDLVYLDAPTQDSDAEGHLDALIRNAKKVLGPDYGYIHDYALTEQLGDCRNDLLEFGVEFDVWYSEKSLFDSGLVAGAMDQLDAKGYLYQQDGATWFRSTDFGDEKDRVVRRDNGLYTYFASDIAYHINKFERGMDRVVNVWGADHHGYIARIKGALTAMGADAEKLTVALVQFAVLYRDGKKAPMSTRSGEFVSLRELRQEVGNDAARFFYVMRKSDQHLDFDLDLAKSKTNENPVYYVQYAHARCSSVFEKWGGDSALLVNADCGLLVESGEVLCLQKLIEFPEIVEAASRDLAPHLVAFYLRELAALFHSYYNATQILADDKSLRMSRLSLVAAVRQVLRTGLALLGVNAPDKM